MASAWAKARFTPDNRPGEQLRPFFSVEEHRRFVNEHGGLVDSGFTEAEIFEHVLDAWDRLLTHHIRGDDVMRCYTITAWTIRRIIREAAGKANDNAI